LSFINVKPPKRVSVLVSNKNNRATKSTYMNIVADAGAIDSVVVTAKDLEFRQASDGHLAHIRHEIVGRSLGVLANQTGLVRTDRIKVPQDGYIHTLVRLVQVLQYVLDHILGLAVRVRDLIANGRVPLIQWQVLRQAVHGGAAREQEILDIVLFHALDVITNDKIALFLN
jgi:hypothetical protein